MPGAPPTSTREPFTAPPPSTRSSSLIPVGKRSSSVASTSSMGRGFRRGEVDRLPPAFFLLSAAGAGCSTMVFQAPQARHLPCHLGVSLPHWVQ